MLAWPVLPIVLEEPCLLVGFSDPTAATGRKSKNLSLLAAVPPLSCLSQPIQSSFLIRYELFSILLRFTY